MRLVSFVLLLFVLLVQPLFGMSSVTYQINWDAVNVGGDDFASSLNYQLNDSLGGIADGTSTGALYGLQAGYRAAESTTERLSFALGAQESATQVTYSAFSAGGSTVTVSSAGFMSVGDYVGVVENEGFSQLVAVGRVASIVSNVITVDGWSGDQVSMSGTPTGGNDFVYRLGGTALAFGTVTAGAQNVSLAAVSVDSTATSGYTVYIQGDGLLRSTGASITSVSDGTVSVGSEEYGMSVTGTRAFAAGIDAAVTSTQRVIGQSPAASATEGDRLGMTFKLSTVASTAAGSYGQIIYYTLTANY
ncbi:hypothetical protein KBB85_02730 [Patescibacteria group bacterium]|nr:hypothetical protein [Patescibacteria group bacterium]